MTQEKIDCVVAVPLKDFHGKMLPSTSILQCTCGLDVLVEATSRYLIRNGSELYCLDCFPKFLEKQEKEKEDKEKKDAT